MAYTLVNKCTKNCSKRTILLQISVEDVVTWFFLEHSVDVRLYIWSSAHLVYQLSIPVICTRIAKNRHFYVPRPLFFVCPRDAPVTITQNVAWMKRQFNACQTPHSMYPSIFNSFPVIRTASAKKSQFSSTAAHIFVSPGDAPAIITQYVAWLERQFNACQTPRCNYLSTFNSFRLIRCLS